MTAQAELPFRPRGGKRPGAGRPRGPGRHRYYPGKRPEHAKRNPVHVTLRVTRDVGTLRRRVAYQVVRRALRWWKENFRVAHVSIQRNHLHLIVEADDRRALTRGLQGFQIAVAKRLNAAMSRRGQVFLDRYHAEPLTSPRQVRNCIAYVLNNFRHHGEDRRGAALDPYASGLFFDGWRGVGPWPPPDGYEPLPVLYPHTWLLAEGWRRHTLIDPYELPGRTEPR